MQEELRVGWSVDTKQAQIEEALAFLGTFGDEGHRWGRAALGLGPWLQLKKPPPELKDPILDHFRLRRAAILDQVKGWASDTNNSPRHATAMGTLVKELEAAFEKHV